MEPAIAPIVAAVLCTKPQRLLTAHQMSRPASNCSASICCRFIRPSFTQIGNDLDRLRKPPFRAARQTFVSTSLSFLSYIMVDKPVRIHRERIDVSCSAIHCFGLVSHAKTIATTRCGQPSGKAAHSSEATETEETTRMMTTQKDAELALVERARGLLPAGGGSATLTPTRSSPRALPAGCGMSAAASTWTFCWDRGRCWCVMRIRRALVHLAGPGRDNSQSQAATR